jgi:hypothetical protein
MVGHRHGRLIKRFDLLDERLDLIGAVEEAELGVEMEVNELRCHGRKSSWRILVSGEREVKPVRVLIRRSSRS